ncbi:MAG: NUMOD1 domain-containing DNA-binding protein [Arcicella sp.]|nr:NUMOD1 domain-containing DNA-binding protein [Arcicella sp.]
MNLSLEDMEGEEWKEIPYFDDNFLVSNYGRVKALPRLIPFIVKGCHTSYYTKERIVPQVLRGTYNGHTQTFNFIVRVHLRYEKKNYTFSTNRLVYELYVAKVDFENHDLYIVHKDGDNLNNAVDNLEISNRTTIFYKTIANDTRSVKRKIPEKIHNQIGVHQYHLDGTLLHHFPSVTEAAKALQTKVYDLKKVLSKRVKQIKGFVVRYETDTYEGEYAHYSKTKKVIQYSLAGIELNTYSSVIQASKATGIMPNLISKCALLKVKFTNEYVWRYEGMSYEGEYSKKIFKVAVHQYSLEGVFIKEFDSITAASKSVNLASGSILSCVRGKSQSAGGYVWRYTDQTYNGQYKKSKQSGSDITQLDMEGNILATYTSIFSASKLTGIPSTNIHRNCKGLRDNAGGFIWRAATAEEVLAFPPTILKRPKKSRPNSISVCQYTKAGVKIATYNSIYDAFNETGIGQNTIKKFLNNPQHVSGQYIWRKVGEEYRGELKEVIRKFEAKTVSQYDLQGNKIAVFSSSYAAKKMVNSSFSSIGSVLLGERKSACGFIWQYGDGLDKIDIEAYSAKFEYINPRNKSVSCYDLEGNKKGYYKSLGEASRENNVSYLSISYVVNGKNKTASNLIWILGDGPDKIDTEIYFLKGEVKAILESITDSK